jgi:hypothetical protein
VIGWKCSCVHSQRAARSFVRGLEIRLKSMDSSAIWKKTCTSEFSKTIKIARVRRTNANLSLCENSRVHVCFPKLHEKPYYYLRPCYTRGNFCCNLQWNFGSRALLSKTCRQVIASMAHILVCMLTLCLHKILSAMKY